MKTLRLFSMLMLLMAASGMAAQNRYIYADPVTIEAGGEAEIVVNIDFDTEEKVLGVGFRLYLPDGVTLTDTESPEINSVTLNYDLIGVVSANRLGAYGVSLYPDFVFIYCQQKNNKSFNGTHGELMRIAIKSSLGETLTFTPELTNIEIAGITEDYNIISLVKDGELVKQPDYNNTVYIDETEATVGKDVTLSVKLRNTVPVEGFGFELVLPTGFTLVEDGSGNPMVTLSEERTTAARTNTFEAVKWNNGINDIVRVVAASTNGSAIEPGDGEVCTVRVKVANGLKAGRYSMLMRNISVADAEAVSHDLKEMWFPIVVLAYDRGDANGDGNVTVADLTAIAHHVLGNTPESFSEEAADANRDGQVNVADYTAVAHLLLYGNIDGPAKARQVKTFGEALTEAEENTLYLDPVKAVAGEELSLPVKMRNSVEAEGFQFSLRLPEGVSLVCDAEGFPVVGLSGSRTDARHTNTFASVLKADGTLTVMAASTNGSAISGSDGEVCSVRVRVGETMANGDYELQLSDISISDIRARSHDVALVAATLTVGEPTAIDDARLSPLTSHPTPQTYDLQGRQAVSGKGIVIREGRKYVRP